MRESRGPGIIMLLRITRRCATACGGGGAWVSEAVGVAGRARSLTTAGPPESPSHFKLKMPDIGGKGEVTQWFKVGKCVFLLTLNSSNK